jgi:hypothetical protein
MKTNIRVLAIYQILGGIVGILIAADLIANLEFVSELLIVFFIVAFGLFGFSIFCGIVLFNNVNKGLSYSKINQILQVIHFMAFGYAYQYVAGINLSLGIDLTESLIFKANFNFTSWQLSIDSNSPSFVISLNLIALFIIFWIDRIKSKIYKETMASELSKIGEESSNKALPLT